MAVRDVARNTIDHSDRHEEFTQLSRAVRRVQRMAALAALLSGVAVVVSVADLVRSTNVQGDGSANVSSNPGVSYQAEEQPAATPPATLAHSDDATVRKFDAAYRAGSAVQTATAIGVTYGRFGDLVQAFASEVSLAGDAADGAAEHDILDHYSRAVLMYSTSSLLWDSKLRHSNPYEWGWLRDRIVVENERIARAASDCGITLTDVPYLNQKGHKPTYVMVPSDTVQKLWESAHAELETANTLRGQLRSSPGTQ